MCKKPQVVRYGSFFSSLKMERIRKRIYETRDLARADTFEYIEIFYNCGRRHSHLDMSISRRLNAPQCGAKISLLYRR